MPIPNDRLCLRDRNCWLMFRQWSSEVKGIRGQQQVGVVTLATAGLQQELGQGLGAALEALMSHLCREACRRCQAALDSCHTLTRYLYGPMLHVTSSGVKDRKKIVNMLDVVTARCTLLGNKPVCF